MTSIDYITYIRVAVKLVSLVNCGDRHYNTYVILYIAIISTLGNIGL